MTELAHREAMPRTGLPAAPERALPATGSTRDLSFPDILRLGETLVGTGFLPKAIKTPQQAAAIILKGQELRIPAMQALSHIHVIEGKPTMSAELMVSLVQRAGHKLRVLETSPESCTVQGARAD
ncbi:MAG: hypothetical protein ACRDSJ_15170, partial [Rubrobacteraceae bacterium]